jgi:hypothetical protein
MGCLHGSLWNRFPRQAAYPFADKARSCLNMEDQVAKAVHLGPILGGDQDGRILAEDHGGTLDPVPRLEQISFEERNRGGTSRDNHFPFLQ